ncbi:unnamed protein product [Rhizoctonia solani]|uniref:Protein kinase domain-containing protein n=1 Tax=Rhizoctonia solani TaxID=456999 RepID=A0A8H3BQG4_9AGAM|nr:unnamed protein product [Rhizoctonia solani]
MDNGSLSKQLGLKSLHNRLKFCIELAGTVEYLHTMGIVHGDIKADNILISNSFEVQLADFGNATLVEYRTLLFTQTSPQFACSPRFTAPEILDDSIKKYTTKSDIYALGMTILHILTGQLPYADYSDTAALAKVFRKIPPPRPRFDGILRSQRAKDTLWAMEVKQVLTETERDSCT